MGSMTQEQTQKEGLCLCLLPNIPHGVRVEPEHEIAVVKEKTHKVGVITYGGELNEELLADAINMVLDQEMYARDHGRELAFLILGERQMAGDFAEFCRTNSIPYLEIAQQSTLSPTIRTMSTCHLTGRTQA
jgi:hypothetical protein